MPLHRSLGPRPFRRLLTIGLVLAALAACSDREPRGRADDPALRPTRGYLLISLDTLGAAHLGA